MASLIAIIDNDLMFCDAAGGQLRKRGFDVAIVANIQAMARMECKPDCVICHVSARQSSGIDLLSSLKRQRRHVPVILVSSQADVDLAMQTVRLGAVDFLVKPVARKRLLAAVTNALQAGEALAREQKNLAGLQERYHSLTDRQRQTMDLLLQGKSNREIASSLEISARTVEVYRAWVMTKMEADSLVHLVRIGIRLGIE